MPSFVPNSAETLEDRRLYTEARLAPVACTTCAAEVLVKKNSDHHTAIQWTAEAAEQCQDFARLAATPAGRAIHSACGRLAASIEVAVREGRVSVGAEDGY